MSELAVKAANGTVGSDELAALNQEYQAYKRAIGYAQTITLLNGHKEISGGDVTITFGKQVSAASSYEIKIPAFDVQSLGIRDTNLLTPANASQALERIYTAVGFLRICIVITSGPIMSDAQAMLLNMPFMLYQDFNLLLSTRNLVIQALNGTNSNEDRALLDIEFNFVKGMMNKTQTYVSILGPKMTGGGKITIQVGHDNSPYNRLEINLPATDISVLGLDKLDINTFESTKTTFGVLLKNLHDFAYGATH
jgi:flagellin-like hook-associated protein FlgL